MQSPFFIYKHTDAYVDWNYEAYNIIYIPKSKKIVEKGDLL